MTDKFKGWYPDYIENEKEREPNLKTCQDDDRACKEKARIREDDKVRSGVLGTGTFVYG